MATQTPPTPPPTRARPKMTVYGSGRPPKKRKRRWLRIALWSFASFFLVLVAGAGVVAYWLYSDYTRITTNSRDVQQATKDLAEPLPQANAPAIALVIGSDHRYSDGSSPSRSDTFMLVRIDPEAASRVAALLPARPVGADPRVRDRPHQRRLLGRRAGPGLEPDEAGARDREEPHRAQDQ